MRGDNAKAIAELSSRMAKVEDVLMNSNNTKNNVHESVEDEWYNDMVEYCDTNPPEETGDLLIDAKKHISQIQLLKQEISEISRSCDTSTGIKQKKLEELLNSKGSILKKHQDSLAKMWEQYSY